MNLRCGAQAQKALAYLWAPSGAFIIDEAPQGAAALYHAVALRSCYGRVAAHEVELSDYAEPSQTFGAMPIVVVRSKIMKGFFLVTMKLSLCSLTTGQDRAG